MIESKCLRSGQARAYQDSVYDYEITSDEGTEKTKEHCLTNIQKCNPENQTGDFRNHSGACGFPFGLESFYTFEELGGGKYRYTVTRPYCD